MLKMQNVMKHPYFATEYAYFEKVLSNKGSDTFTNLLRNPTDGSFPITYGDKGFDSEGKPKPAEEKMTESNEFYSYQCLDQIIELRRNKMTEVPANLQTCKFTSG